MKQTRFLCFSLLLFLLNCASEKAELKEEVRFLLDARQYTQAIEKAREVVAKDSDDAEASFLLASALLGDAALSGANNCPEGDQGILGLLACLADPLEPDENDLSSFLRIAPDLARLANLEEATDIFKVLDANALSDADRDNVFIRLYASRLFELGGALTRVGLKTANDECNHCLNMTLGCVMSMKDEVPDGFDADALTPEQETRFRENLTEVNEVGGDLGLSQDFSLILRADQIAMDLGIDPIPTFFDTTFNSATQATCDETP